jgi:hypothetical protein
MTPPLDPSYWYSEDATRWLAIWCGPGFCVGGAAPVPVPRKAWRDMGLLERISASHQRLYGDGVAKLNTLGWCGVAR